MAKRKVAKKSPSGSKIGKAPKSELERKQVVSEIRRLHRLLGKTPTWAYKKRQIIKEINRLQRLHDDIGNAIENLQAVVNTDPGGGPNPKD